MNKITKKDEMRIVSKKGKGKGKKEMEMKNKSSERN